MTQEADRLTFLDNLRTFIIFCVVLYHVGWVYEKSGMLAGVWIVSDPARSGLPGLIGMILDIFMMPTQYANWTAETNHGRYQGETGRPIDLQRSRE